MSSNHVYNNGDDEYYEDEWENTEYWKVWLTVLAASLVGLGTFILTVAIILAGIVFLLSLI